MGDMPESIVDVLADRALLRERVKALELGRDQLLEIVEAARKLVVVFDDAEAWPPALRPTEAQAVSYYVDQLVAELRAHYIGLGEDPDVWLNQRMADP